MPKKERVYEYHVTGFWPFPLDMLRRDQARGATPGDQEKIEWLSKDEKPEGIIGQVTIQLHGACQPTRKRWQSFGWEVYGSVNTAEITLPLTAEEQLATLELIRQARADIIKADAEVGEARATMNALSDKVNQLRRTLAAAEKDLENAGFSVTFRQEEADALRKTVERLLEELD